MPFCPHCLGMLADDHSASEACPHCGKLITDDESLAGKQTFDLIPGDSTLEDASDNVLDDIEIKQDDEATLPFGQTVEFEPPEIIAEDDDKGPSSTIDHIVLDDLESEPDEEATLPFGQTVELSSPESSGDESESNKQVDRETSRTADHIENLKGDESGGGDATIDEIVIDDSEEQNDPRGTVDYVGDATVEFDAPPKENQHTVDFDSDKTIDLSSSDPELAAKVSSQWMGTVDLHTPTGQTVRQEESEPLAKQKSTLPVKSRSMSEASTKGTVTYISPSDAPDYELLNQIGEGGMGVVYAARQSSIARTVAVKMLKPTAKVGAEQRDKFISEAVVTGELDHPNIVPIYDLGSNDKGALFYSMKHVQGTPWEDVLAEKSLEENLNILLRVADAVAFAHARGVVHRDLKPENVMLGEFGEVLVMDWGLARVTTTFRSADSIHQSGSLGGTPAYMSPEMARGPVESINHTSDIYLLGAILYEIIGDRPPHSGKDVMQCLMAAAQNVIDPIDYQGELLDVALRAMNTEQSDRYQSVKDFQTAVRTYLSHSESLVLSSHAERHLGEARENNDYQLFARAMYGFEESLALWSDNAKARALLTETRTAYASQALANGDLDLAMSLLDSEDPDHGELLTSIRQAQRERGTRQAMLKWTKRAVAALLLAIVALGTYSYITIAQSNVEIAEQRDEAKRQEGIAIDNANLAAENEAKAVASAKEAAEQRDIADAKREEAEEQRQIAEQQEQRAIAAQRDAERNEQLALQAKAEEEQARKREEYEAYVAGIGLAAAKIDENAYDFALELLADSPPERRDWEWGRLRYLCQLSEAVYDVGSPVDAVAYSPDGQLVASGDRNGAVEVRRIATGELVLSDEQGQYVYCVAFSPDSRLVAAGSSDGNVRIVDVSNGELQATLSGHDDGVLDVDFSHDGKQLVSASYDNTARVWDLATSEPTSTLAGHNWWVWSARFSPDASRIVTASQDSNVIVWRRAPTGGFAPAAYFTEHEGPVYAADFAPSGAVIATGGYDKTIRVWSPDEVGGPNLETRLEGSDTSTSKAVVLKGHTGAVRSVDFGPDSRLLLSGSHDNTLRLWSLTSGSEAKTLRGHGSRVEAVALSPDAARAASGSLDGSVRVWDVSGYAESQVLGSRTLAGHDDAVLAARFASDGRVVTASRDRTARLWDAIGTELVAFEQGHEFLATSAMFVADGQQLITGAGDNTTRLWSVGTGAELQVMRGTGRNGTIAADRDGRYLVTGGEGNTGLLWDLATGNRLATLTGHNSEVTAAAFAPSAGMFATGDNRGTILVWKLEGDTATQVAEMTGHSRAINQLRFAPSGQWLHSASGDNTCAKWDVATGNELADGLLKHPDWVAAMDLSNDGQFIVTACEDGRIRVWDATTAEVVAEATLDEGSATGVDFAPDGSAILVTSSTNGSTWQWNWSQLPNANLSEQPPLASGQAVGSLWTALYAPDGRRALTIGGNDARLLDLATGEWGMRFSPHGAVATVAMSPDGQTLATGSWDGTAKLWNTESHQVERQLVGGHTGYINSLDFSPTGKLIATASDDGTVRLWNVDSGKTAGEPLVGHKGGVHSVRFSPDGSKLLTTGSDRTARLWDARSGRVLQTFSGHKWGVRCGEFSADGALVVTGSDDNTAVVWDTNTGESLATMSGHTSAVTSVAFTPDATRVLTGSQDTTAKLWDAANGGEILTLTGHTQDLTAVDFSSDGRTALTASRDGTARLWPTVDWTADGDLGVRKAEFGAPNVEWEQERQREFANRESLRSWLE